MTAKTDSKSDTTALFAPIADVERYLDGFFDARPLPRNLRDAMKYSAFGPGKRMRPLLVILAAQAVGGTLEQALPPAAAIEMIHCFSLIHDDLPAMDDDDLRRGRPTLHKHTNEAMAILAGDALTGLAFELVATRIPDAAIARQIVTELAIGTNDMINGQVYDTLPDFDPSISPIERLRTIHRNKTGALIRCSCRMGAIVAGATSGKTLDAITDYADAIGLMFQVVDDLLDVTQTTEHLGKAANKDADKGKLTYPGLIGIDASRGEVTRLEKAAHDALARLPANPATQQLRALCDIMASRTK